MKRKNNALLLSVLLVLTVVFLTNPAYAISTGWERYKDDKCEIYLEYFPVFLFDPYYPTASEEFAIKYYIMQDSFWMDPLNKFVPLAFKIRVGYRDVTDGSLDWTVWKRWYPLSMEHHGMDIAWRVMYGGEGLTLGATVSVSDIASTKTNYTQDEWVYNGNTYMFLGSLCVTYASNVFWGQASCDAGGSIGIPNDLAMNKEGHHVEVLVEVTTWWIDWIDLVAPRVYKKPPLYFVLGDDIPATTDCWLNVEEGTVGFGEGGSPHFLTVSSGSGGTTQPPPSTRVYDDGESVTVTASAYTGYTFDGWILDGSVVCWDDSINVTMDSDHTLRAYFSVSGGGGGGGGGGDQCPTLFVWNGIDYVDYGVIGIHNPSGEDVIREMPVQAEDVGITNNKAKFRLREGWEGLEFSESVIDQVKLYSIDDEGKHYLCPLINAEHSTLGNVLPQLLLSDDVRVETHVLETIDLTFVVPYGDVQDFTFVIEGCNMLKP